MLCAVDYNAFPVMRALCAFWSPVYIAHPDLSGIEMEMRMVMVMEMEESQNSMEGSDH